MAENDTCDIYCFNEEKVKKIQDELKKIDMSAVVKVLKALADENRAKISYALCREDELCVCDVANIIRTTVATASHHLRTLYKQGIVKYRKEGKLAFYSLVDDHIQQLLMIALDHAQEVKLHD